ncbi:MAG TPA: redoxin domain-containing protein [Steroidobacteraceae bacterium]|nr:redoxin domain-containing protein [Steroidobacteraceae bacterium]
MRRIPSFVALLGLGAPLLASGMPETLDNFRLTDQQGTSRELYYLSDQKAVVLLAQGTACEASQQAAVALESLRARYESKGIAFLLVDANVADGASREALAAKARQDGVTLPILMDETQLVSESLGFTRNGEVVIADPQGWKVTYRGGIGAVPVVLDSMLAGAAVKTGSSEVAGCAIDMPERARRTAHAQISYEKTIAPMLLDKCVTCHRAGGIGPWQMSSYDMIKGFAPMIREVVRTQRMPPWHADPHYSVFGNDRGLSTQQARTLVHWIEAGAPRGGGSDPLLAQKKDWPAWPLGKPDLIVDLPAFTVPATGTIPYQMTKVENPLDHDVWIRAIDWLPGERSIVHHIIASAGGAERRGAVSLNNYVPGVEPLELPPEAGILLPAHATFHFQTHYTSNGKVLTDQTRMGLYFRKDAPQYNFRSLVFANGKLRIPANTKWHEERAEQTLEADAIIYTLHPHAHYRGKASRFVAYYPDGKQQTLLNIPAYDFNWQGTYELREPMPIPAGTRIVYSQWYDNSTQNRANPDASREVTWGEQTWDEMIFGVIRYRNVVEDARERQGKGQSQEELFAEKQ